MAVFVDRAIKEGLRSKHTALDRLAEIERLLAAGRSVPLTLLKPSGQGRSSRFQGYIDLGLWHAKLDPSGRHHGDPLLVFQMDQRGDYTAVASTNHEAYASPDHDKCRRWLWEHRAAIEWDRSAAAQALLGSLDEEFGTEAPCPRRK